MEVDPATPDDPGDPDIAPDPSDPTSIVPTADIRLADFIGDDPPLPLALLLVVAGPARATVLTVDAVPAVLGRSAEADLVVADDTVSRRHARLSGSRDTLEIEDLGSSNGTTLNGNPIAGTIGVLDGDIITFGSAAVLVKRIC